MTAFDAFNTSPSPDTLMALLRAHQDGVYTVCLNVLRNPHDAEDAAQEALLKIAAGAKDLREPRAFKSWLYRLAFRTAVDHLRNRATRRRAEEGSAPMQASLSDEQREAIHEAMSALPDDDRLMLVEHYFEKTTIEELGRREGISDVAMGKRLEKAREKFKRGLAGAGILLGGSQITHALESVSPVTAPSGLVGSAIGSNAALIAMGGVAVGTKSASVVLIAVAVFLLMGVGGGILWFSSDRIAGTADSPMASGSGAPMVGQPADSPASLPAPVLEADDGIRTCRNLVSRLVARLRSHDVSLIAWEIHRAQAGQFPVIEEFVQAFTKAAGDRVIPFSRQLLAESESDAVRLLIAIVLGRSRAPGSFELLSGFTADDLSVPIRAAALYSVGLLESPQGLALIQSSWERVKKEGGPLGQTLLMAVGLQGAAGLEWLLAELRSSNLGKVLSYQGVPWSYSLEKEDCLSFIRGTGAFAALRRVYESDPDPVLRAGAARAMLATFDSSQVDYLVQMMTATENAKLRPSLVFALQTAPKSSARTDLVDRVLTEVPYPSGDVNVDRSLVRLAQIASPAKAASLFEQFMAHASTSKDEQLFWNVGAMYMAVAGLPEAEARIAALMKTASFTAQQRGIVLATGLYAATPETAPALSRPVLELVQTSDPSSDVFANCIQPLLLCGLDERVLSTALQDLSDRQAAPADRLRILQQLMQFAGGGVRKTREMTIPRTFLASTADQAKDPESLLCAVHALASSGSVDLNRWQSPIAEWIGRDMRWVDHAKENSYLSFVAPSVIGDFYARFGTADDADWLEDLPETFPYPASWNEAERNRVKSTVRDESRRAIDAIRLRN